MVPKIDYERIRKACARLLSAEGKAFQEALAELSAALEPLDEAQDAHTKNTKHKTE
jgi:hypothetical protein